MNRPHPRLLPALASLAALGLASCAPAAPDPAPSPQSASAAGPAEAVVLTTAVENVLGPFVADADGRALYLRETHGDGPALCDDACARTWPPLLASGGAPTAGDPQVRAELIGTVRRPDGSLQVTYGGHPLHLYVLDRGDDRAMGQAVHDEWGGWYLVTPAGEKLERLREPPPPMG